MNKTKPQYYCATLSEYNQEYNQKIKKLEKVKPYAMPSVGTMGHIIFGRRWSRNTIIEQSFLFFEQANKFQKYVGFIVYIGDKISNYNNIVYTYNPNNLPIIKE